MQYENQGIDETGEEHVVVSVAIDNKIAANTSTARVQEAIDQAIALTRANRSPDKIQVRGSGVVRYRELRIRVPRPREGINGSLDMELLPPLHVLFSDCESSLM